VQDGTPATPGLNSARFRDSVQIPFVGIYGAASYGGLLVDGQIRGNFFQNEASDDNRGMLGQHFDAHGIGLTGNVAYIQKLSNYWFVEPSAGIVWSRTHVDPLNVQGTGVFGPFFAPGFVLPAVTVNDIESALGRLTVRVGKTITSGSVVWQPFASASVIHEFQGGATSSLLINSAAIGSSFPNLNSTVSTSSFGTLGQFGVGVAARAVGTGWIGYLRADYRHGEYIDGWSLNGSLRYEFVPDP
jgi:outer membrane autotransporter protein